eukprot:m.137128 g.137128  ORF g.137128 m.137128 type:complete len:65 (-) comp11455_c0_seq1:132-326(-)
MALHPPYRRVPLTLPNRCDTLDFFSGLRGGVAIILFSSFRLGCVVSTQHKLDRAIKIDASYQLT